MSKVTVQIDTNDKTIEVSVDGKSVGNVEGIHSFSEKNSKGNVEFFSLSITKVEEEGDLRKVTHLMASRSKEAIEATHKGLASQSEFEDFIETEGKSKVQKDIEDFLS